MVYDGLRLLRLEALPELRSTVRRSHAPSDGMCIVNCIECCDVNSCFMRYSTWGNTGLVDRGTAATAGCGSEAASFVMTLERLSLMWDRRPGSRSCEIRAKIKRGSGAVTSLAASASF
jgi:hypothetical protein